ncbi:MAG TPA: DNA topoisomerase IV subunit B, partial [Porticoccus sp.]|nr:DNA topoisomerase IV subunit B [Porticoccus sp.]
MSDYNADSIEVLTGLDPVRKRPGMYTETTRPNHLAQEVIDNSVDEALAGFAQQIDVVIHKDGSLTCTDDGRGMPVDLHPEQKKPGVEVILTTLHAGGKFNNDNYQFSGGLHGVGVSVVNALSKVLEINIRRNGEVHNMEFKNGDKSQDLKVVDTCGKRNTGTSIRFLPDPSYFDSAKFSVSRMKHVLRAKAVLCPGLRVTFKDEASGDKEEWHYEDGLYDYMVASTKGWETLPSDPFIGSFSGSNEGVDWAVQWLPEGGELTTESYVNLIPTTQGGTHVNGLRTGLLEAIREFCEFRNLLPRGIKLSPDDIWDKCCYVLSSKLADPQFSGQTKE